MTTMSRRKMTEQPLEGSAEPLEDARFFPFGFCSLGFWALAAYYFSNSKSLNLASSPAERVYPQ